jgi:hypothetical protein
MYDEATTMLGSLGRHGGGAGNQSHYFDRSVYNCLYGAPRHIIRITKDKKSKVVAPRFHMFLNAHPHHMINLYFNEKGSYDDGLLHRFWTMAPRPPWLPAKTMRECGQCILSLACLFFFIYILHSQPRNYKFTPEALRALEIIFDSDRSKLMTINPIDSFFGATLGKNFINIVRLSAYIKALDFASKILHEVPDSNEQNITAEFMRQARRIASTVNDDAFLIDLTILKHAETMSNALNMTKLILASYNIEPTGTLYEAYTKIVNTRGRKIVTADVEFLSIPKNIFKKMKEIFQRTDTSRFSPSNMSKGNLTVAECNQIFQNLEDLELGKQRVVEVPGNHVKVNYFFRISPHDLQTNAVSGENITKMGMSLTTVIDTLKRTEIIEQTALVNQHGKRTQPFPDELDDDVFEMNGENKKIKISADSNNKIICVNKENNAPYILPQNLTQRKVASLGTNSTTALENEQNIINNHQQQGNAPLNSSFQSIETSHSRSSTDLSNIDSSRIRRSLESNISSQNVENENSEISSSQVNPPNFSSIISLTQNEVANIQISQQTDTFLKTQTQPATSTQAIESEYVNGKLKYYTYIDGLRVVCSKNGIKLGSKKRVEKSNQSVNNGSLNNSRTHPMQTRRNSQTESEPQINPATTVNTNNRHINSVRTRGFNPLGSQSANNNLNRQPSVDGFGR